MKVIGLTLYKVKPRWMFLKVMTDEGINGWGELISGGKTKSVEAALYEMGEKIIGCDPKRIEDIWQMMFKSFFRGGPTLMTVISGIEIALWDIKARWLNVPIYELLGGKAREKIMVYSWISGKTTEDFVKAALEKKGNGFHAIKLLATENCHYIDSYQKIKTVADRIGEIRSAVGDDFGIGIDFHGRIHKGMAKPLIHELEPFHPMFIEEPLLPEHGEHLREIKASTFIPIASGERLKTRWEYKDIITGGAVDIIQPDIAMTGGILETRKICAMAETYDIAVAPHAPYGPISLAASFQLDVCTPNVFIQEQSLGMFYNQGADLTDYVINKEVFEYKDGFAAIPNGPGLGIEVDEKMIENRNLDDLGWSNPTWRNEDGTITEW